MSPTANHEELTCQCANDRALSLMFDLMDRGLGQWEASWIAYGGADHAPVGASWPTWCGLVVHRLGQQLRGRLGLPALSGATS